MLRKQGVTFIYVDHTGSKKPPVETIVRIPTEQGKARPLK